MKTFWWIWRRLFVGWIMLLVYGHSRRVVERRRRRA